MLRDIMMRLDDNQRQTKEWFDQLGAVIFVLVPKVDVLEKALENMSILGPEIGQTKGLVRNLIQQEQWEKEKQEKEKEKERKDKGKKEMGE